MGMGTSTMSYRRLHSFDNYGNRYMRIDKVKLLYEFIRIMMKLDLCDTIWHHGEAEWYQGIIVEEDRYVLEKQ